MDPRKKWMFNIKKKKPRYAPGATSDSTIKYNTPDYELMEYNLQELERSERKARARNELFRNELNQITELNRIHGTHNRRERMRRGGRIAEQMVRNNQYIETLQNQLDEIYRDYENIYDDVSSN